MFYVYSVVRPYAVLVCILCSWQRQFEPCACKSRHGSPRLTRLTSNKRTSSSSSSSRGRLRAAAKRGRPVGGGVSRSRPRSQATAPRRRRHRRRRLEAVWDGTLGVSTLPPATATRQRRNRTRAGRGKMRRYSKQLKAAATRNDPSLPANG